MQCVHFSPFAQICPIFLYIYTKNPHHSEEQCGFPTSLHMYLSAGFAAEGCSGILQGGDDRLSAGLGEGDGGLDLGEHGAGSEVTLGTVLFHPYQQHNSKYQVPQLRIVLQMGSYIISCEARKLIVPV